MRIVERYPTAFSIFTGRGLGILFLPGRAVLSLFYWIWISLSDRDVPPEDAGRQSTTKRKRDGATIISVGNIEVGGSGKTPCVIALASEIARRGGSVAVVTRGYKSEAARHCPFVVSAGTSLTHAVAIDYTTEEAYVEVRRGSGRMRGTPLIAQIVGDEVMLYRNRNIPVVIDPKRARGIDVAQRLFAPTHILLDDAYQQRSIHKDLDILLLDASDPLRGGMLLPLGLLREKPSAVRRADAVIFTRSESATVPRDVELFVKGGMVRFARHRAIDLAARGGASLPLSYLDGTSVSCFSGIARPDSFEGLMLSLGARIDVSFRYIDHHTYTRSDIEAMTAEVGETGPFITTEKDWVKVAHLFPDNAEVYALRIAMDIDGIGGLLDMLDRG